MIYNLPISFVYDLEAICTIFLKKWLGVTRSITVTVLYRSKEYFGLNMKKLSDLYKALQVSKGHALKNSDGTKVIEAYNNKREKQESSSRVKMVVYDGRGADY